MSLSILVVIEMLNACNALSQSESLLTLPVWKNMKLVYAIALSMALHFAIVYVPFLQSLFQVAPLNWEEWKAVFGISAPVMYGPHVGMTNGSLIDEVLKLIERVSVSPPSRVQKKAKIA